MEASYLPQGRIQVHGVVEEVEKELCQVLVHLLLEHFILLGQLVDVGLKAAAAHAEHGGGAEEDDPGSAASSLATG